MKISKILTYLNSVIQPCRKLNGVGYTCESGLPDVVYTGESLVQPSIPANALKGIISKSRLWVLCTGYWEKIIFLT
jgi:hypothetical protein